MPKIPTVTQLRRVLPYAARLLPLLTGAAPAAPAADFTPLNHRFGEMQTESRGIRTEVQSQKEQLTAVQQQLDRLLATHERVTQAQAELAVSLRSLATLGKGLFSAVLVLLVFLAVLSVLVFMRVGHA